MSAVRDVAVVLKLTEFMETSQVVTLFGEQGGQLRLMARGARRGTKSRFAAGLDLLERGELTYLPPRPDAGLGTLTEWRQLDAAAGLRRSLGSLYGGLYAAECVTALTQEHDPHPGLFAALVKLLGRLGASADAEAAAAIVEFQHALLREVGFSPVLDRCVACGRRPAARGTAFFSSAAGGVLCRDCEMHHAEKRRMPGLGRADGALPATEWFDLLDYHVAHVAGRAMHSSATLRAALRG